jgi:hypothetical protein
VEVKFNHYITKRFEDDPTCGLKLPKEVQSVGGFRLMAVNDEGDDERVDDRNHEVF